MTMLIVEDNPISAAVLEHTFDKYGYETMTAHDGNEALKFLEAHPEIDMVITDILMPNTDGVELVRTIKSRPEWSEIPILVCTSINPDRLDDSVRAAGGEQVFKPIRANILMEKVNDALAHQKPVLQKPEQTISEIGVDAQAFNEILDAFLAVVREKADLLEKEIKEGSTQPLDLQHLLEAARLIRAERIIDILERLNRCPNGERSENFQSTYPLLLRELKATEHHLSVYTS